MKRFLVPLALAGSLTLSGCAWFSALQDTATKPFPGQDTTVDLATQSYTLLGDLFLVYKATPQANPVTVATVTADEAVTFTDLQTAWKAQDAGDNAAIAVALNHVNKDNAAVQLALSLVGVKQ